ncbi:hypothetical protein L6452_25424 [Arctium lappa]|uniref:Uncharacterized protein n=1 Tax=Arctium lappa TaxID=4217 RepID=A0ACB9ABD6_ARCLA|nr:hypothetical protein L6452_25424 [Arctium lappa]
MIQIQIGLQNLLDVVYYQIYIIFPLWNCNNKASLPATFLPPLQMVLKIPSSLPLYSTLFAFDASDCIIFK